MKDAAIVSRILAAPHSLHGKQLNCKKALPKEHLAGEKTNRKVFVGGLLPEVSQEEFFSYFDLYGPIVDCVVMRAKNSCKPRCFGFVTFFNQDSVDKVLEEYDSHRIHGKWVECKLATPKEQVENPSFSPASTADSGACESEEICMKVISDLLDDDDDWLI